MSSVRRSATRVSRMKRLGVVLLVGLAAERSRRNGIGGSPTIRLNRTSVFSAEAGLLGLFSVFVSFAWFGPGFEYWIGLTLFSFAIGSGLAAIVLAHRAAHANRRDPYFVGRNYATIGFVTGWLAFLVGISYLGLVYLLLHPFVWVLAVPLVIAAIILHADRWAREDDFRRSLNLAAETAACRRCGRNTALALGRWRASGWLCPTCDRDPWGVYA